MRSLASVLKARRSLIPSSWSVAGDVFYNKYSFYDMAQDDNGKIIGVGGSFVYSISTDYASTWKTYRTRFNLNNYPYVFAVAYGDGKWLMGYDWLAKSTDGINWTKITYPFSGTGGINKIKYNGVDTWIVMSSSQIAVSPDGETWTLSTTASFAYLAYGNGIWVASNNNDANAYTSPDGFIWTARSTGLTNPYNGNIDFVNGFFVKLGYKEIARSSDGISWTIIALDSRVTFSLGLASDGINTFVTTTKAYLDGSLKRYPIVSTDSGLTWSLQLTPIPGSLEVRPIIFINGDCFFFFINSLAQKTTDFISYVDISMFGYHYAAGIGVDNVNNNVLTTATTPTPLLPYKSSFSSDNISWITREEFGVIISKSSLPTIVGNDGIFVLNSYDGLIITTDNGASFSISYPKTLIFVGDLAYGNGMYVATEYKSDSSTDPATLTTKTVSSPDGINWSVKTFVCSSGSCDPYDIPLASLGRRTTAYGNGIFMRVLGYAVNYWQFKWSTSIDGINWTNHYQSISSINKYPADNYINDITYGNGMWIAVGDYTTMAISYDGLTWTDIYHSTLNSNISFQSIVWDGSKFLVAGGYSPGDYNLFASEDGINWQYGYASQFKNILRTIRYVNGEFIASISNSALIRSAG